MLKVDHLESNSIVTRELIPLLYVESANQNLLQSIQPPLLCQKAGVDQLRYCGHSFRIGAATTAAAKGI